VDDIAPHYGILRILRLFVILLPATPQMGYLRLAGRRPSDAGLNQSAEAAGVTATVGVCSLVF
jgi:hypothetical protein